MTDFNYIGLKKATAYRPAIPHLCFKPRLNGLPLRYAAGDGTWLAGRRSESAGI